jgi:hypothetical protein
MTKFQSIQWPRIFAEGTAIVASILLAFAIQAWWEDRQQQVDERIVLQSLFDDLNEKKVGLAEDRIYVQAIFDSATKLLQVGTNEDLTLPANEVDELLGDVFWYSSSASWESAPMESLIVGGEMAVIKNASLLQMLAVLQNSVSQLQNNYDADKKFHYDSLAPFLTSHANLPQIVAAIKHTPGRPESTYGFPELNVSNHRDHAELISRQDFQGLLVIKMDLMMDIFRTIKSQKLTEQLDETTATLAAELDNL